MIMVKHYGEKNLLNLREWNFNEIQHQRALRTTTADLRCTQSVPSLPLKD